MKVKLESNQLKDEFENMKLQLKFKIEEINQKDEENKMLIRNNEENKMFQENELEIKKERIS